MGSVNSGLKAADDLATAAKNKSDDGIASATRSLGATCTACHAAHRDRQPDGSYTVR